VSPGRDHFATLRARLLGPGRQPQCRFGLGVDRLILDPIFDLAERCPVGEQLVELPQARIKERHAAFSFWSVASPATLAVTLPPRGR
jgi:hypothetical protein